jgi:HK97 gp10 family phage protein
MISTKAIDIRLLGNKRLQAKFAKLEGKLQKKVFRQAARAAAKPVLAAAKQLCPAKTGKLKGSLKIGSSPAKSGVGAQVQTGTRGELGIPEDSKIFYPAVVEYGHDNVPAHSYLRKAMDQERTTAKRILTYEIAAKIRSAAK